MNQAAINASIGYSFFLLMFICFARAISSAKDFINIKLTPFLCTILVSKGKSKDRKTMSLSGLIVYTNAVIILFLSIVDIFYINLEEPYIVTLLGLEERLGRLIFYMYILSFVLCIIYSEISGRILERIEKNDSKN